MHSLVHLATRGWVGAQAGAQEVMDATLAHLVTVFWTDDWDQRETWRQYMPHVLRAIRADGSAADWGEDKAELGFWAGRCLKVEGRIREAVELLQHVVAVEARTLAEDHPSRLASQHALAGAYKANGQVKEAVEMLEHVVAVRKTTLAEDHPSRLASQHELARAYKANGQVKEAVELLEHVVAVKAAFMSPGHPSRIVSEEMLAWMRSEAAE